MRAWVVAILIAATALLIGAPPPARRNLANIDQPRYLSIAHDLRAGGVFTDGREAAAVSARLGRDTGQPGAAVAPFYPALLAGLGWLNPTLRAAEDCVAGALDFAAIRACPPRLGVLVPVQCVLAAATMLITWRLALAVTRSGIAGWGALIFAGFSTGQYAAFAYSAMTEAVIAPLLALFLLALVRVAQGRRGWWVVAGGTLGLAMLTRPEFEVLAGAFLLAAPFARGCRGALCGAALLAELITLPWRLRNLALLGHAGITFGYGGFVLAQRMAYQAMNGREFLASWLYALPGFGPALARHLFGAAATMRLGWEDRPDTFYMVGNTRMIAALRQAVPDPAAQPAYLLRQFVWPHPVRYMLISVSLAWKSLFVRKYTGLVGLPCLAWLLNRTAGRPAILAMAAPPLVMALAYGAVSVATPRYGLDLLPCYAVAFGAAVAAWRDGKIYTRQSGGVPA